MRQDHAAVGGAASGPRRAGWASQVWHRKSGITGTKTSPNERTDFISLLIVMVSSNSYECGKPSASKMQSWSIRDMNFCNPSVKHR